MTLAGLEVVASLACAYGGLMFLENLVMDAVEPQRVGRFWQAVVDGEQLTDEHEGYEMRLAVEGGPVLDFGFQRVRQQSSEPSRLQLEVLAGGPADETVERLVSLGAERRDTGSGTTGSGVVLADPEGNDFRVTEGQPELVNTGPIAALRLASADGDRDRDFWAWLSGWGAAGPTSLRHPSRRGPQLVLCPESAPKGAAKNRIHLDIRLERGDNPDDVAAGIEQRGGRELHLGWGDLPWRHFADPSGNELCLLPAPA